MLLSELFNEKPQFSKVTNGTWLYSKATGNLVLIYYADGKMKSLSWLTSCKDQVGCQDHAFWWTNDGVEKKCGTPLTKEDLAILGLAHMESWTILSNEDAADILVGIPDANL